MTKIHSRSSHSTADLADGLSDHEILKMGGGLLGRLVALEFGMTVLIRSHCLPDRLHQCWEQEWPLRVSDECDGSLPEFDQALTDQGERIAQAIAAAMVVRNRVS